MKVFHFTRLDVRMEWRIQGLEEMQKRLTVDDEVEVAGIGGNMWNMESLEEERCKERERNRV